MGSDGGQVNDIESPIEEILLAALGRYCCMDALVETQRECETTNGTYRLDFAVTLNGTTVGVEADGKAFHDATRDRFRDALIVRRGPVSAVCRFRGKDIVSRTPDVMFALSVLHPELFCTRRHVEAIQASFLGTHGWRVSRRPDLLQIEGEDGTPPLLVIDTRFDSSEVVAIWRFADAHPGLTAAALAIKAKEERYLWWAMNVPMEATQ